MGFCFSGAEEERPGFRVAGEPRSELVPASENHPETTKVRLVLPLGLVIISIIIMMMIILMILHY